jgi:hypothetical protein
MTWTRSLTLALATQKCSVCRGSGMTIGRSGSMNACDCVLRGIFKVCYNRFRVCAEKEKYLSKVSLEIHSGPNRRGTWGRKDEEYVADFINVSRHALDEQEYRIFKFRFLLGADWKLCCRKLGMDRGTFHHMVYNIQEKLGQVFAELQPYALYPVQDYFSGTPHREPVQAFPAREQNRVTPIRPPVAKPRIAGAFVPERKAA